MIQGHDVKIYKDGHPIGLGKELEMPNESKFDVSTLDVEHKTVEFEGVSSDFVDFDFEYYMRRAGSVYLRNPFARIKITDWDVYEAFGKVPFGIRIFIDV